MHTALLQLLEGVGSMGHSQELFLSVAEVAEGVLCQAGFQSRSKPEEGFTVLK